MPPVDGPQPTELGEAMRKLMTDDQLSDELSKVTMSIENTLDEDQIHQAFFQVLQGRVLQSRESRILERIDLAVDNVEIDNRDLGTT